jgi:type II secretory pathway pseudopilin PulG
MGLKKQEFGKKVYGISLIEVLIVMVIVLLFLIVAYIAFFSQIGKARDAKRKDDLERIRIAFEDYFNDYGCYPSSIVLENCGDAFPLGADKPYLHRVPCDPKSKEPYLIFVQQTVCPTWYIVLTTMENQTGLSNPCQTGCNFEGEDQAYYYYITSGNISPWEIGAFLGFGDSPEEGCPVEEGCFEIDDRGNCNSSGGPNFCTMEEQCFLDDKCSAECSIPCCKSAGCEYE